MVDVPVLKIPVDDSEFKAFLDVFNKFRIDAADIPQTMEEIDHAIGRLPEHLQPAAAALEEAAEGAAEVLDGLDAISGGLGGGIDALFGGGGGSGSPPASASNDNAPAKRPSSRTRRPRKAPKRKPPPPKLEWAHIGARRFGSSITSATRDLARWERMTAVFSGLLGAGGLYGLNTLAAAAAQRRQESSGLGLTSGQAASFNVNYRPLGDVGAVLSGLSGAETDFAKRQPLQSLGIDPARKNSLTIFGEMLPKLKRIADEAQPGTLGATTRAYGLDRLGVTEEMMRVIRATSREDLERMRSRAGGDVGALEIPDSVGRGWQELVTTLHKAETEVQTALAGDLVRITPGVEALSKSATAVIDKMLSSTSTGKWLDDINDALVEFAGAVGSTEAQDKFKSFLDNFRMAQKDFDKLNAWLEGKGDILLALLGLRAGAMFGLPGLATAAIIGGSYVVGKRLDKHITRLPAPQSGGRTLGDDLGLPGVEAPAPDKESQVREPHAQNGSFLNERSQRELSGVNAPLAENLLEASARSGIQFQVNEGRRSQAEADANAARGIGVRNSQHLYGAAADVVMIDPATGQKTYDRAVYEKFAKSFYEVNRERGTNQRWLGSSAGRWGSDIVHFDQGIGYGQTHAAQPYGHGTAPTKEDQKASREEVYRSPANPFGGHHDHSMGMPRDAARIAAHRRLTSVLLHPNARPRPQPAVRVTDNSGSAVTIDRGSVLSVGP